VDAVRCLDRGRYPYDQRADVVDDDASVLSSVRLVVVDVLD